MNNSSIQHPDSSLTLSALVSETVYRTVVGIRRVVNRCISGVD